MSETLWPMRISAAASELSRMQDPQYMPAAPAARMLMFKAVCSRWAYARDCRRKEKSTKSEARNPKQIPRTKRGNPKREEFLLRFVLSSLVLGICFGFRA